MQETISAPTQTKLPTMKANFILVELIKQDRTAGGLVLPDQAKDKISKGKVIAIGPGRRSEYNGERLPMETRLGETILFFQHSQIIPDPLKPEQVVVSDPNVLATVEQ